LEISYPIPQNTKIKPISQGSKPTNPKKKKKKKEKRKKKKSKGDKECTFQTQTTIQPPWEKTKLKHNISNCWGSGYYRFK
jgi:hypothetical protein